MPHANGGDMLTGAEPRPDNGLPGCAGTSRTAPAAVPPRRLAGPPGRMPRVVRTWLGPGMLAAGLGMIPWLFILASTLPSAAIAAHWSSAWLGLDGLEAAGLLTTGLALIRGYDWVCLPAAVTATLLVIDAWFDVTTSAPGSAATEAIAMAIFPELPMAGLCIVLAVRNAPGRYPARTNWDRTAGGASPPSTSARSGTAPGCKPDATGRHNSLRSPAAYANYYLHMLRSLCGI